ncbi:MAG: hypothetical protein CH6_0835 [Candidatus Kapaibacterium sp.]|nr:MAG: hypothetical protein CH6_0835 [Candidatus Kapabacteria bacterium]
MSQKLSLLCHLHSLKFIFSAPLSYYKKPNKSKFRFPKRSRVYQIWFDCDD